MENDRRSILIADDSRAVRQLLGMVLKRHVNCDITEAEDGQAAYEMLRSDSYDLLITDINMPRMNGLSLIGRIRNEMGLKIPIVIVTTMGREEDRDAGINLGADTYITKPINGSQLVEKVAGLVN